MMWILFGGRDEYRNKRFEIWTDMEPERGVPRRLSEVERKQVGGIGMDVRVDSAWLTCVPD